MRKLVAYAWAAAIGLPILFAVPAAQSQSGPPTAEQLATQIEALKQDYEKRVAALEARLAEMKAESSPSAAMAKPSMRSGDNSFNPAIGIVLNGMLTSYSEEDSGLPGFQLGHHSERPQEGLGLGHSEITASGNIDDKFRGNLTLGLGSHDGVTELDLEEAYIQTLPGSGMPDGIRLKAGRALWTFGYLNEQHAHGDDFSDRPLPYRAFLDGGYNDDGAEVSVVLPGAFYKEVGAGIFRGDDMPFGGSESGSEAWSAYVRLGGDVTRNSAFRIGAYMLNGEAHGRGGGHAHGHGDEHAHDEHDDDHHDEAHHDDDDDHHDEAHHDDDDDHHDEAHHDEHDDEHEEHAHDEHDGHAHDEFFSNGLFTGDAQIFGVDLRYTYAPTGNARERELILQGEYFLRRESGSYTLEEECEGEEHSGEVCEETEELNGDASGWYAQAVYKFLPRWRAGVRYSHLSPPKDAELGQGHSSVSTMLDWTNSEFGRVRFQYNREAFGSKRDHQFILQYIMSLGAHGAHSF